MRNVPFRVAFIGEEKSTIDGLLPYLSPALQPRSFPSWEALGLQIAEAAPELVVVLPGNASAPPYPLSVPVLPLVEPDLGGAAVLEARILADSGTALRPRPIRLLGQSDAMARLRATLLTFAQTDHPLLLTGENGTGKDLAANVAHEHSHRSDKPWIAVNCGAIPHGLAETEFFGCVRGAFTGAENRAGYCQQAQGGTLFLDEIGELPLEIQSKLLRALENNEVRRVGSGRIETVDFRLICATNRDLGREVEQGRFRQDLYYRINVLALKMPALRERKEDIPLLVRHFLDSNTPRSSPTVEVDPRAMAALTEFSWPGNLRQLRNVVLRSSVLSRGRTVVPEHLFFD